MQVARAGNFFVAYAPAPAYHVTPTLNPSPRGRDLPSPRLKVGWVRRIQNNRGSEACWLPARDCYYLVSGLDSEIVNDAGYGSLG